MNTPAALSLSETHRANPRFADEAFAVAGGLSVVLIGSATLFRGGNRALPLIGLEWLGLAICLAWGWGALLRGCWPAGWGGPRAVRWTFAVLIGSLAWVGLALGQAWTPDGPANAAALASWPVVALGLMGLSANPAQTRALWRAWLWVALAQAAIGLMQLGGWEALRFGLVSSEKLIGTFASKNTYSNFMVMAIPLAVYGWLGAGDAGGAGRGWAKA